MILKGLECSNCDETFEWISEATLHVCKEKTKYTCDFICACPANNSAERVSKALLTKLREGVVELERWYGHACSANNYAEQGTSISSSDVLALLEKAGE